MDSCLQSSFQQLAGYSMTVDAWIVAYKVTTSPEYHPEMGLPQDKDFVENDFSNPSPPPYLCSSVLESFSK